MADHHGMRGVEEHLRQSLSLLGKRPRPDYRNAIKEAISAVESAAKRIAREKKGPLDDALDLLDQRMPLHGALKAGLTKLRRLTLGVSLVLLCAGLALTARDVYRMMEYRNTLTIEEECRSRAGSDQKAKDECGSTNATFPSHVLFAFGALVTISQAALSYNTFINVLDVTTGRPGYPFFGFIMSLDLAVSLAIRPTGCYRRARQSLEGDEPPS